MNDEKTNKNQDNHTNNDTVLVLHDINRKPFTQEHGIGFHIGLVERVEQRMTGTIRRRTGPGCLPAFAKILWLTTNLKLE